MYNKKSIALLLIMSISLLPSLSISSSNNKLRVAIMPFENLSKAAGDPLLETLTGGMAESLITGLCRVNSLILIERSQIKKVLEEQTFSQTGVVDPNTAPQMGKLLGANKIILGSFQVLGNQIKINARITDVETGVIDPTKVVSVRGYWTDDVFDLQDKLALLFIDKFGISSTDFDKDQINKIMKPTNSFTAYDYYIKGRNYYLLFTQEGYKKAIDQYKKAIEIDANYSLAYAALAEAYSLLGLAMKQRGEEYEIYYEKGLKAGKKAISLNNGLFEAHRSLANIYGNMLEIGKAEEEAKIALKINPNDAESYMYIDKKAQPDEKIKNLKKAINLNPNLAAAYLQLGALYTIYSNNLDLAIMQFKKVIEINPRNVDAYTNLATCFYNKADFDLAILNYKKALELNSNDILIHTNLGSLFTLKNEPVKAIEYFNMALALNPNYPSALSGLGTALYINGEDSKAISVLNRAITGYEKMLRADSRSSKSLFTRIALGDIYVLLGKLKKAKSLFKEVLKYKVSGLLYASSYNGLARVYSMSNKYKQALKNFEKAVKLGGDIVIYSARIDPAFNNIKNEDKFVKIIDSIKK